MLTRFTSLALFTALFGVAGLAQAQEIRQNAPAYGTQSNSQYGSQSGSQNSSQSSQQDSHPHWLINHVFSGDSSANNRATGGSNSNQSGSPSYGTSGSGSSNNGTGNGVAGNGVVNFANPQNTAHKAAVRKATIRRMAARAFERRSRGSSILRILNARPVNRRWPPRRCTAIARRLFPPSQCPIPKRLARVTIDRWRNVCGSRPIMGRSWAPALRSMLRPPCRLPRRVTKLDVAEEVSVPADPAPDHITHNTLVEETAVSGPAKLVGSSCCPVPAADIGSQTADAMRWLLEQRSDNALRIDQSPQFGVETIGPRTIMIGKEAALQSRC